MHISERGLVMIEGFEGFSSTQYDDGTGVMTIGFGTTSADVSPLPRSLTRAQAEQLLRIKLAEKYEPAVNRIGVPVNQDQFDALVSIAYNCGTGVVGASSTLGRLLRAREYRAAADAFRLYVHAGGRVLQGLVNRRAAERALFLLPPPLPPDPHHYRWYDATPRPVLGGQSERGIAVLYDHYRAEQTFRSHPHRDELARLRVQCAEAARRIESVAGPRGLGVFHRRYRRDALLARSKGKRVV